MSGWRFEARVDATPDAAYAWMTDFTEHDHGSEAFRRGAKAKEGDARASKRTVVSREGNRVKIHDVWGRQSFDMDVELVPARREVVLTGQYGYSAVWRAEPDGAGTRIVNEGKLAPTGFMKLLAPLFARSFAKQMRSDFDGHLEEMREDLAKR